MAPLLPAPAHPVEQLPVLPRTENIVFAEERRRKKDQELLPLRKKTRDIYDKSLLIYTLVKEEDSDLLFVKAIPPKKPRPVRARNASSSENNHLIYCTKIALSRENLDKEKRPKDPFLTSLPTLDLTVGMKIGKGHHSIVCKALLGTRTVVVKSSRDTQNLSQRQQVRNEIAILRYVVFIFLLILFYLVCFILF